MLVNTDREALISISQWIRQGEDWVVLGEERRGHKVLGSLIYLQKLLSQQITDNVGTIMQPLLRQTVVISLTRRADRTFAWPGRRISIRQDRQPGANIAVMRSHFYQMNKFYL